MKLTIEHDLSHEELASLLLGTALAEDIDLEQLSKSLETRRSETDAGVKTIKHRLDSWLSDYRVFLLAMLGWLVAWHGRDPQPFFPSTVVELLAGLGAYARLPLGLPAPLELRPIPHAEDHVAMPAFSGDLLRLPDQHYTRVYRHGLDSASTFFRMQTDAAVQRLLVGAEPRLAGLSMAAERKPQRQIWAAAETSLKQALAAFDTDKLASLGSRFSLHMQLIAQAEGEGREHIRFIVADDACGDCRRLYLDAAGEPRWFRIEDLRDNIARTGGMNSGPRRDWVALPIAHPWCRCRPESIL